MVEVNRAIIPNSDRLVAQNIDLNGATIVVTNVRNTLVSGDTFQIVQANGGTITGTPASLTGALPPGPGAAWDASNLNVNGTIRIILPPSPVLTNSISGGGATLDFSWDSAHLGWRLYAQTNSLAVDITSTNWVLVAGTEALTFITVGIDRTVGTVFYRLSYP